MFSWMRSWFAFGSPAIVKRPIGGPMRLSASILRQQFCLLIVPTLILVKPPLNVHRKPFRLIYTNICVNLLPPTPPSWLGLASKLWNWNEFQAIFESPPSLLSWHGEVVVTLVAGISYKPLNIWFCPHVSPLARFEVASTHLVPLSILSSDPVVCADIQRREDRSRRSGGIGTAVVLLQCNRISQVMPVEVESTINQFVSHFWSVHRLTRRPRCHGRLSQNGKTCCAAGLIAEQVPLNHRTS